MQGLFRVVWRKTQRDRGKGGVFNFIGLKKGGGILSKI